MMDPADHRPDPEALLWQVQAEETYRHRGRLKVFLGYASGVGKSFRMLDEARRRRERGEDVVVAAVQQTMTPEAQHVLGSLEQIPALLNAGQAVIDVREVLRRHPEVCVIDGLAYDNPPGSRHAKRFQDIEELLDAGISVLTSVNLQHVHELREAAKAITHRHVAETVPVEFLHRAEEIEIVDAPAEVPEEESGLGQSHLLELREMALVLAADVVDRQLEVYLDRHGITATWGTQERILVCLTPRANARRMIASGRRNADRFHGELLVVYVRQPELTVEDRSALGRNLALAQAYGAQVEVLDDEDPIGAIVRFARQRGITQIFVGHTKRSGRLARFLRGPVDRLLDEATDMDVRVFPQ